MLGKRKGKPTGIRYPRPKPHRTRVDYRAIARYYHPIHCVVRGCKEKRLRFLEVHHRDGNSHNNTPANLEWRCRKHHLAVHGKWMHKYPAGYTKPGRKGGKSVEKQHVFWPFMRFVIFTLFVIAFIVSI